MRDDPDRLWLFRQIARVEWVLVLVRRHGARRVNTLFRRNPPRGGAADGYRDRQRAKLGRARLLEEE